MSRWAILLAAGRGERLRPLTSTRPKPLLPIPGDETLLARHVEHLAPVVDGVVVVASYMHWMVEEYVSSRTWGVEVRVARQEEPRGTSDAVRAGLRALPRSADEVLVVYADLLLSKRDIWRIASLDHPTMGVVESSEPWRYGVVEVEGGEARRIIEKPPRGEEPSNLVNAGIYKLPRTELEEATSTVKMSPRGELEFTDAVNIMLRRLKVRLYKLRGTWLDIGRPWHYLEAVRRVMREKLGSSKVYIAPWTEVSSSTVIEPPAWIEAEEVGPNTHIRPYTFLARGSRVGTLVQVKASVLMEAAKAPHLNYVGDSVVGEAANLGAGSVTANLRFDKASVKVTVKDRREDTGLRKLGAFIGGYAQLGVNASTLPGVRIGAFSWVEPGAVVARDVPDCSFYRRSGEVEELEKRGVRCTVETPPWRLWRGG